MSSTSNSAGYASESTSAHTLKAKETTGAFIDSVGVNMHSGSSSKDIPYAYRDTTLVEHDLQYLDITHIRDGLGAGFSKSGYDYTTVTESYLAERGYDFDFPISTLAPYEISALENFATKYPGALKSLEGPNEANYLSVDQAVAFQQSLYDTVHSDPLLKDVPVMDFTLAYAQPHYFEPYGNLASISDEGNVHIYGTYGRSPYALDDWLAVAQAATPDRQMNITETGYSTVPSNTQWGVDETTQAKYLLDTLMDAAENGVGITYLYELLDRTTSSASDIQGHYGLFRADGTPKPSAVAIHNMMNIFEADAKASTDLGNLDVVFAQPLDKNVHTLVLQKSENTFDLVLWAEPNIWDPYKQQAIQAPNISVNLSFPGAQTATLFDPMIGTAPVQVVDTPEATSAFNVSDHPIIIEVTLGATYVDLETGLLTTGVAGLAALKQAGVVTTIAVRDTAANLAGTLATLGADAKVSSITVSDGDPLALTYTQFKSDTAGLNKIASYDLTLSDVSIANLSPVEKNAHVTTVGVSDTAAKLTGTEIGVLGADAKVTSIAVSDGKPITLSYAQYAVDGAGLAKLTGGYAMTVTAASAASLTALDQNSHVTAVTVRDTAANLGGNEFGLLGTDAKVQSIAVTDVNPLALTYTQYQGDGSALAKLTGSYRLSVTGTAVANLAALEQDTHVTTIGVYDTAANLAGALSTLGADTKVKSIVVSDGKPLTLTYAQFKSGTAGLNKIASYGLTLSDVSVANLSVEKNTHVTAIGVSDTSARLSGTEFGVLGANAKVTTITASDGKPITLTYAQYTADSAAIGKLASSAGLTVTGAPIGSLATIEHDPHVTSITILDTAANVASAFDDLQAHAATVTSIRFTDKATPSLTLTAAQAEADAGLLPKITSPYVLDIEGTHGAMSSAFEAYAEASSQWVYTELSDTDGSHSYEVRGSGLKLIASHNDDFNLLGHNETVVFGANGFGSAEISGFTTGDVIQFSKSTFANFSELSTHVSGTTDAVITDTAGDSLTLKGINPSHLASSMFKFI